MVKKPEHKHVVVSGGSRGLGLAIVGQLLDDGYSVSTFSRHSTDAIEALAARFPERLRFQVADISKSDDMRDFVSTARSRLGPVYGLINNAAVAQGGILATLPEVEIDRMLTINLSCTIKLTRICLKDMLLACCGRIINISSIVGTRGYNGLAVYSATKAAMDGLTRSLSRELGARKITVNSIGPGYMRTEMSAGITDSQLDQIVKRTPLGRLAAVDDVTPVVSFILSKDSSFITGQTILVDGGISN